MWLLERDGATRAPEHNGQCGTITAGAGSRVGGPMVAGLCLVSEDAASQR